MQAKMLLASAEHGCTSEAATISAMLQVQSIFLEPPDKRLAARRQKLRFSCKEGDHLSLLNVFNAFVAAGKSAKWCHNHVRVLSFGHDVFFTNTRTDTSCIASQMLNYKSLARATEVRKQLLFALSRHGLRETVADGDDPDAILRCVCAGFFANAARLHMDGTYRSIRGDTPLFIHPSSVLYIEKPPRYCHGCRPTTRKIGTHPRTVSPGRLPAIFSHSLAVLLPLQIRCVQRGSTDLENLHAGRERCRSSLVDGGRRSVLQLFPYGPADEAVQRITCLAA